MFTESLRFEPTSHECDFLEIFPAQIECVRQTAHTLEFLRVKTNGSTSVVCVQGIRLGVLLRELLAGKRNVISIGPVGPQCCRASVQAIIQRYGWTRPKDAMALDPNATPPSLFQFENGLMRDHWRHDAITGFAVPSGRAPKTKILLQFRDRHAYVLHTLPGTFSSVLAELKKTHFRYDMVNRFSTFIANPYPPCPLIRTERYTFDKIDYEEKNLAVRGEWEVVIEFPRAPRADGPSIDLPR